MTEQKNKNVDTSNIFAGKKIKNYKQMCKLLNESEKIGNSRKYQIKSWENYFLSVREGNSISIREVYETPKVSIEKRGGENNKLSYVHNIEKLILDLMVQDKNNGKVVLSKYKLLNELNMINDNYAFCKRNVPKLSRFMNISEEDIYEFYDISSVTLKNNLESALNKLKSQSLIFWKKAITLCIVQTQIEKNELEKIRVKQIYQGLNKYGEEIYEYRTESNSVVEYRVANEDEIRIVLRTERETMESLNCYSKQEVIRNGKWDEFNKYVNRELFDKLNLLFYYDSYDIIFNEDHIMEKWMRVNEYMLPDVDRIDVRKELNNGVTGKLNLNTERRHNKSNLEADKTFGNNTKVNVRRSDDNYTIKNDNLIHTLVDVKHKDIRKEVRKVDLKVGLDKEEKDK